MSQPAAGVLDLTMLYRLGVDVHDEWTKESDLPLVADPRAQLGSRLLLKYIRPADEARYSVTSGVTVFPGPHWLTPTPLHHSEVESALNLPPMDAPVRVLLLLPELLTELRGPRRIAAGQTVEYVCESFGIDALASPQWGIKI